MLIDDITIKVMAGEGGDGKASFTKNMMSLGPSGASGGNGGNVYVRGVSDIGALGRLRRTKVFHAKDGKTGGYQFNDGTSGEDLYIDVPVGTVVHNVSRKTVHEITAIGEERLIAKGGKGGRGNFHFKSSTNTSPRDYEEGDSGEKFTIRLELKLIADAGLIGLPNAGKSSLLNELTAAKSRVANYPFTTLEPNLGVYYELILADIPGIIEGASTGKGLGIKFLRHVERTKVLMHLVSAESDDLVRDYKVIRAELSAYNKELLEKTEYLFLSKSDTVSPAETKKKLAVLQKLNKNAVAISVHDWDSLEKVKKILNKLIKDKIVKEVEESEVPGIDVSQ